MNTDNLREYLENKLTAYLSILKKMVDINSFTLNRTGIEQLAGYTDSVFGDLGFTGHHIHSSYKEYGTHLVLEKKGNSNKTIAFISHLDTVFSVEEEKKNHFRWKHEGDRIYGPGTVDIKGGTVMIYIVLDLLRTFCRELYDSMSFTVLLDCAEEVGGADFGIVCRRFLQPDKTIACLVFEGSNLNSGNHYKVISRKGMATFDIAVKGRSSHSGTAHIRGADAIVQMSDIIQKLNSITDYKKNITVNFGKINGGTVRNRVADGCKLELEMRASDLNVFNRAVETIESLNGPGTVGSASDNWKCMVNVDKQIVTPPWERNSRSEKLFAFWSSAARKIGMTMKEEIRGGLSDGNLLWRDYAVLDGLGPGGDNSHCSESDPDNGKEQEYLAVSSIIPVAVINTLAISDLIETELSGSDK